MKKLVVIALALVAFAGSAFAAEDKAVFKFKDNRQITVVDKGDFIEITTANNTLRVYPCGQVDRLKWEKLNPNEDSIVQRWNGGGSLGGYGVVTPAVLSPTYGKTTLDYNINSVPAIGTITTPYVTR